MLGVLITLDCGTPPNRTASWHNVLGLINSKTHYSHLKQIKSRLRVLYINFQCFKCQQTPFIRLQPLHSLQSRCSPLPKTVILPCKTQNLYMFCVVIGNKHHIFHRIVSFPLQNIMLCLSLYCMLNLRASFKLYMYSGGGAILCQMLLMYIDINGGVSFENIIS